jgi:hypothetical protein
LNQFLIPANSLIGVVASGAPRSLNLGNAPQLRIVSVGGVNAPTAPIGTFSASPDITLPANQTNPVSVLVEGMNIPVGARIDAILMAPNGSMTSQGTTLTGTLAASTATMNIVLPVGTSVLTVTTAFDVDAEIAGNYPAIEGDRVRRMQVAAAFGGRSRITYITESGRQINVDE